MTPVRQWPPESQTMCRQNLLHIHALVADEPFTQGSQHAETHATDEPSRGRGNLKFEFSCWKAPVRPNPHVAHFLPGAGSWIEYERGEH